LAVSHENAILYIDNQPIKRINKFNYLDSIVNNKWETDEEVKIRVAMAKAIFARFDKYLLRQEVPLSLRLRIIK